MESRYQIGERVARHNLAGNIALAVTKAVVGTMSGSVALIADALHSGSDAISTVAVIVGMRMASKPPDAKHPYGHSRAETVAAKVLSILLILAGLNIAYVALRTIYVGGYHAPGSLALWTALLSIVVKEGMFQYTARTGRRIRSNALMADAWHHRSDALSSVAAFVGLVFARVGYPVMDPIIGVVVAGLILRVGWKIFTEAVDEIMDAQVEPGLLDAVTRAVTSVDNVRSIHSLSVHRYGSEYHVDLTVTVPPAADVVQSHAIVHQIEHSIGDRLDETTHVDVHVEPDLTRQRG